MPALSVKYNIYCMKDWKTTDKLKVFFSLFKIKLD